MILTLTRTLKKVAPLPLVLLLIGSLSVSDIVLSQTDSIGDAGPDTTGVWYHIRHKQVKLANEEFTRLKTHYLNWTPSADLLDAMDRLNRPQNDPTNTKSSKDVARQGAIDKEKEFAGRIASQSAQDWANLSDQEVNRFIAYAEQEKSDKLKLLTGWLLIARQQFDSAISYFSPLANSASDNSLRMQAKDGIAAALSQWVNFALSANDLDLLNQIMTSYSAHDDVKKNIDSAGWEAFKQGEFLRAKSLFELSGNIYGISLSLDKSGQTDAAMTFACQHTDITEVLNVCMDKLAEKQLALFNDGKFQESLASAAAMAKIAALTKDAKLLKGWAEYRLNQFDEAVTTFSTLFASQPDDESIQDALFTALNKIEKSELFFATLDRFPVLQSRINAQTAKIALARKQFELAYLLQAQSAFEDRRQLNVYAGLFSNNRSGTPGLDKFHQLNPYIGISKLVDNWRISMRFDYMQLYSDQAPVDAWFGNGQYNADQYFSTGIEDTGVGFSLSRQLENINLYGDLRYHLFEQAVNLGITGQLGLTWFGDDTTSTLAVYRLGKNDSLLSTAGARDQTLQKWGGVVMSGVKGMWVKSLKPDLSLAINGDYAALKGELTERNHFLSAGLSLNFDGKDYVGQLTTFELDYARIGPRVNYFAYDKNQSLFTLSHGGYFSPQKYWNIAAFAQVLSAEGQDWQVKLDADIGFSSVSEEGVNRLQYDALSTEFVPSTTTNGISANILLEGQWKIAEHWVISGFYRQANAVRYRSSQFGVQLSWKPSSLIGLTSDGLINNNPWYSGFALW